MPMMSAEQVKDLSVVLRARLQEARDSATSTVMTAEALHGIRAYMVNYLQGLRADKMMPEDVNPVAVRVIGSPHDGTVQLHLPYQLKLYLEADASVFVSKFEHDSDCCTFLAHKHKCDLYFCSQHGLPTVLARQSSEPADYVSGMPLARLLDPEEHGLGMAYALAVEKGYVQGPGWITMATMQ